MVFYCFSSYEVLIWNVVSFSSGLFLQCQWLICLKTFVSPRVFTKKIICIFYGRSNTKLHFIVSCSIGLQCLKSSTGRQNSFSWVLGCTSGKCPSSSLKNNLSKTFLTTLSKKMFKCPKHLSSLMEALFAWYPRKSGERRIILLKTKKNHNNPLIKPLEKSASICTKCQLALIGYIWKGAANSLHVFGMVGEPWANLVPYLDMFVFLPLHLQL